MPPECGAPAGTWAACVSSRSRSASAQSPCRFPQAWLICSRPWELSSPLICEEQVSPGRFDPAPDSAQALALSAAPACGSGACLGVCSGVCEAEVADCRRNSARNRIYAAQEPAQPAHREHPPPLETQSTHLNIFARRRETPEPSQRFSRSYLRKFAPIMAKSSSARLRTTSF